MNKYILPVIISLAMLTGCSIRFGTGEPEPKLSPEEEQQQKIENEHKQIADWFAENASNEKTFKDTYNYQYYARALGLDKDYFLNIENWEVFYNEKINLNREIDNKAIYLIRLNPDKLLEIYAQNNDCTVDEICEILGQSRDTLYYNWGYTVCSATYENDHKNGVVTYSELEEKIFGEANNEDRKSVMSTHFITYAPKDKTPITYSSTSDDMEMTHRDFFKISNPKSGLYNFSDYGSSDINPVLHMGNTGISRIIMLNIPNAYNYAENTDKAVSVMMNYSPFSYGCLDDDLVDMSAYYKTPVEETKAVTVSVSTDTAVQNEVTANQTIPDNIPETEQSSSVSTETQTEANLSTDTEDKMNGDNTNG